MNSQNNVSPLAFQNNDCNIININNTNATTMKRLQSPLPPQPSAGATYIDRKTGR
jgi:hypothetical protein